MSLHAHRGLLLLLAAVAVGCGREEPTAEPRAEVVTGSVSKGPLRGAAVDFFLLDAAGAASGSPLVPPVTTDASGSFTVSGLPAGVYPTGSNKTFDGLTSRWTRPWPWA